MGKVLEFLSGKKTYITMLVAFALGGLQAVGYPIPEFVYAMLGALGLAFVRAGIAKAAA